MSARPAGWRSIASAELLLSLRAPSDWAARPVDERRVELVRDGEDGDGYHATLSLVLGEPEAIGPQAFEHFCEAAPATLADRIEGFESLETEAYRLSSHAKVFTIGFRQHARGAPPTSHLQAYVWANRYRMYLLTGATSRACEARDLLTFGEIVRSLRLLPPRA